MACPALHPKVVVLRRGVVYRDGHEAAGQRRRLSRRAATQTFERVRINFLLESHIIGSHIRVHAHEYLDSLKLGYLSPVRRLAKTCDETSTARTATTTMRLLICLAQQGDAIVLRDMPQQQTTSATHSTRLHICASAPQRMDLSTLG